MKIKYIISLILVMILLILPGCGKTSRSNVVLETAQPTATVSPTPTPTVTPTPTPTPTATPTPTTTITKQPTSETKTIGSSTMFIANADNYDTVTWYCVMPSGTIIKADQVSAYFANVWTSGTDTTSFSIGNIQDSIGDCGFYAIFKYNNTETRTDTAYLNISREIFITHNPTDETRNLGTDWYWDSSRSCARNNNTYLQFAVQGTNIESVQWYIRTDHDSPAGNYDGVIGANSLTLSIPARSDLNGCSVYAVVSNSYGYSTSTSCAHYYVTYTETPTPTASIKTIYADSIGEGGYISSCPSYATPGSVVSFTLGLTNSQASAIVSAWCCNTGTDIVVSENGMTYTFIMPTDDVYINVSWMIN